MSDNAAGIAASPAGTDRLTGIIIACVGVSLALHAGVIAWALLRLDENSGRAEFSPSVVSLERIVTETLDAVGGRDLLPAHGAVQSIQAVEAEPEAPQTAQPLEALAPKAADQTEPEEAAPAGIPAPAEAAPAVTELLPEPPIESVESREAAPAREQAENRPKAKARAAKPERNAEKRDAKNAVKPQELAAEKGKARREKPRRGSAGSAPGGRASASAGAMSNYAARVRAAVARRRPAAGAARGTAVISFALTPGGALASSRLARSSGNPTLDRMALGAVRGAAFPRPPAGATASQLRFTIPFFFR